MVETYLGDLLAEYDISPEIFLQVIRLTCYCHGNDEDDIMMTVTTLVRYCLVF